MSLASSILTVPTTLTPACALRLPCGDVSVMDLVKDQRLTVMVSTAPEFKGDVPHWRPLPTKNLRGVNLEDCVLVYMQRNNAGGLIVGYRYNQSSPVDSTTFILEGVLEGDFALLVDGVLYSRLKITEDEGVLQPAGELDDLEA